MSNSALGNAQEQSPAEAEALLERIVGGRFRLQQLLKSGNGVATFLALDELQSEPVIIKAARSDSLPLATQLRLEHEAGVLARLQGPFLVPLLHLGREDNLVYLVMPLVAGVTLQTRLARGPLAVRDALVVGRCLFAALRQVHDNGILHRDIKPANIIVDEAEPLTRATLVDFGLARTALLHPLNRTPPVGTVRYMSPEQAGLLDQEPGEQADLYSAGVVLFECLAGRPPFTGTTVGDLLRQHLNVTPPELRGLGLKVPRVLDDIVQRLLRKDPRDRYQTAAAVLADLDRLAEALDMGVAEPGLVIGVYDQRRTLTQPAFVGRETELTALEAQVEAARQGEGGLVLLEAESGGGKTRLLDELTHRSTRDRVRVLRGQGVDQVARRPFQLLLGVVAGLVAESQSDRRLAGQIRSRLGHQWEAACAALPELRELFGEAKSADGLGPETFGEVRSLQALSLLLDALGTAERPALVLLDDCQWADHLTLQLLRHWQQRAEGGQRARHVLVVVAFRSEEVADEHLLRRLPAALRLTLPPFPPEDIRRLAESMAGALPPEALEVVERLSEGSPFMAAAVLQGLVESAALLPAEPHGWQVDPLALADVQSSRHAVAFLVRRIEGLPTPVFRLLCAAAVLGKDFDREFAATLAGQTAEEARAALREAHRRRLVWGSGAGGPCAFVHDKLRQTLLERLPPAERRALHYRAASYLAEQAPERVFDLAYHFDAAGASDRALPYALAAAEQARARHALEIAEQQYRIAERGLTRADEGVRFAVAKGLGEVLMLRGRYAESARAFEIALALARSELARAEVEGQLGELAFKCGDVRTAGQRIEQALWRLGRRTPRWSIMYLIFLLWEVVIQILHTLLPNRFLARRSLAGAERERLVMRLYSRLAILYWFHRGTVPALWAHLRELNLAECYPPTPELAQAYSEHAPGMSLLGWFRRGIAYAEKSLVIRTRLGDLWGQGRSLHFYGVVLYANSQFEESIRRCREAVRLLERTGDYWEMHIARYQIAASLYRQGQLQAALEEARRLYQSGVDLGDVQASGISLDVWARAALGQVPAELVQAESNRPSDDVQRTAQVLTAEGVRLLYRGNLSEATDVFEKAQRLVEEAGVRNAWVSAILPWWATALRQQAEKTPPLAAKRRHALLRRATAVARRALKLARLFRNELPHALREAGLIAALNGRRRVALRHLAESLAVAERQGACYEAALTRVARAQLGVALGEPDAADRLAAAQQALRQLEAEVAGPAPSDGATSNRPVTLSLADRFDTLLDAGRRIARALTREEVYDTAREAALQLLRGERCLVLDSSAAEDAEPRTGPAADYSRVLVRKARAARRAVAHLEGAPEDAGESVVLSGARSVLCAPVFVRGQIVGYLYVTHRQVAGLFGEDELRLADTISTLTGAALENAEGFEELRRLNAELERQIQERRQAEQRIREQAALLDKAHDAISVQDLDDHILYWNHSAERLYGWSAAEALGRRAADLLGTGPAARLQEALQAVQVHGEWTGELQQTTRAGKEIIVESRWTLVRDEQGRPSGRLVVNTDVTDKKLLEARLLRAQRMESLGTLAGGIAHDLNNVLLPIMLSIPILRQPLPDRERCDLLDNLQAAAQRGADMVRQLFSFARGTEGQQGELHLGNLVREVERLLERTFPKSIAIVTRIAANLWPVRGDATQVHRLLMNLCVNARDAMPDGGQLTLSAANIQLDEVQARRFADARPGAYVLLTISDTGTGIPPKLLDKIFDPFFTTKEYGKGTGLGLSTVLGIVKGHGGFIHVESTVGHGTRFFVYLPVWQATAEQQRHKGRVDEPPPAAVDSLVLVVDDEFAIRDVCKRALETAGFRVLIARDGTEAEELYRQHHHEISLVLTDLVMPGRTGKGTIEALRQLDPQVRIVAMSGLSAQLDQVAGEVQAVLPKPFRTQELVDLLGRVLQQKKACA